MNAKHGWPVAIALLIAIGCGGEDEATPAESACDKLVDAFASAWERCGRESYDGAQKFWADALDCGSIESFDAAAVDECAADVGALSCAAVQDPASPNSCARALAGDG